MANNGFGKLMFVLGLLLLALLSVSFFSWAKLIWLVLFVVLGLLSWKYNTALFWYFLANTVVSLAWAISLSVMNTQSLLIYLIGLVSAAGLVGSAASMGGKKVKKVPQKGSTKQASAPSKKSSSKISNKKSAKKASSKTSKSSKKRKQIL